MSLFHVFYEKYFQCILVLVFLPLACAAQIPQPSSGMVKRFEAFQSKYVMPRNVDVWLPEGYNTTQKYAVLYMHDGQMLFDTTYTWNHQEWNVDEILAQLMKSGKIRNCIVVGVWNNQGYRSDEYFPEKPIAMMSKEVGAMVTKWLHGKPQADHYLKFLVKELKPFVDQQFSTFTDQQNTFVAGSSMGGLISMYAISEYPDVFGGAACFSTHWVGDPKNIIADIPDAYNAYMKTHLPAPANHKIYFDYGDQTLDNLYKPYQQAVDKIMMDKGYTSQNWMTKEFAGHDHSEQSWSKRFHIPMLFLLKEE